MPFLPLAAPTFSAGAPHSGSRISPSNLLEKLIGVEALRDPYAFHRHHADVVTPWSSRSEVLDPAAC
ncbi:hypothetical protein [Candidatus Korobacter versatilis]|uniref:hypothetical protein n=1 Tax=Candidatus Korobacter versatilis TaxID=658062 RepID=UPI0003106CD3|nr:hypothetical protein [Candidatus Koribacter versatilis]